ncbi:hypothetical protein GCM10008094_30640 [Aidingimonas halophila]|nr:hypothetical protein GCM10008094_30640 [Aidingimonas halophila]
MIEANGDDVGQSDIGQMGELDVGKAGMLAHLGLLVVVLAETPFIAASHTLAVGRVSCMIRI